MAWIIDRHRKDGTPYWAVCWREGGRTGKQESITWYDRDDAVHCKDLIDKLGPEKARDIMKIITEPRRAQTVAEFLTAHVDHLTGVEPGTTKRYRAYIRNDLDGIGDIPLRALTREDVARWVNAMSQTSSAKTVKNKRDFLSGALKAAVKAKAITANPAEDVRNPRWDRREMVFLTAAEFRLLLDEIPAYWKPLIEFLVASGARWSEATALRPADIDISLGTVRISKAWKTGSDDGGYTLGVPKTRKSVRTINVPASVLEKLDLTGEWVFTNSGRGRGQSVTEKLGPDPNPVRIHSFAPNVWRPAIERAKLKGLTKTPRIHDLRHTAASWLLQAGRPMPSVQQHLGHESIQTTVDVYGHLDRSSGQGNADAIDAMLTPVD